MEEREETRKKNKNRGRIEGESKEWAKCRNEKEVRETPEQGHREKDT